MKKIQTSRKTMWAVDEKLVFNKCWPYGSLTFGNDVMHANFAIVWLIGFCNHFAAKFILLLLHRQIINSHVTA